jgi:hypothetical protein
MGLLIVADFRGMMMGKKKVECYQKHFAVLRAEYIHKNSRYKRSLQC